MSDSFRDADYVAVHENPVWRRDANSIIRARLEGSRNEGEWEQLWARHLGQQRFVICAGLANELSHAGRAQIGRMDLEEHPRREGATKDDDASNKFENELIKEYNKKYGPTYRLRKPY